MSGVRRLTLVILLAFAACSKPRSGPAPVQARAEDAEAIDVFDTSAWPGKNLPLKPGFRFHPADYPQLNGYAVKREGDDDALTEFGWLRQFHLGSGEHEIWVVIGVGSGSNESAQRLLVADERRISYGLQPTYVRGDRIGIELGDVAVLDAGATREDLSDRIRFVRRNIYVKLQGYLWGPPDRKLNPLLTSLAKAMDARILAQPDVSPAGFEVLRPIVSKAHLSPDTVVLRDAPDGWATLRVTTSDPRNEQVRVFADCRLGAKLRRQEDGSFLVRGDGIAGDIPIVLRVVNESLLFSESDVVLRVRKP